MNVFSVICGGLLSAVISYNIGAFSNITTLWIPLVLWLCFYIVLIAGILLLLFIVSLFFTKKPPKKPNKVCYYLVKIVVDFLCKGARIKTHVRGGELIKKDRRYVLVSNHRSKFDPMLQIHKFFRCKPIMISKPENLEIPLAGPFINKAGFLAIDRNNDREALKTIVKAIKFIEKENVSVGVCPEGTRNRNGRNLLPLKAGSLKIATRSKAPIAVMTFEGTEKIAKNFPFKRTDVYIDVLKIIEPNEYEGKNTHELADEISKIMQANIDAYTQKGVTRE